MVIFLFIGLNRCINLTNFRKELCKDYLGIASDSEKKN